VRDHYELLADVPARRSAICGPLLFLVPAVRKPCAVLGFASDDPRKPNAMRVGEKRRIGGQSVAYACPPGAIVA